jgi:CHASE2 domain-containing sensor protein
MSRTAAGKHSRARALLADWRGYFAAFLSVGIILLWLDPFGLTRLTKNYSQDLLAVALAGCYPDGPGKCGGPARAATNGDRTDDATPQTRVAVVLLSEEDLRRAKEAWPPSYRLHARVLKAIRANHPTAVFVDIVLEDERRDPTIEDLRAELEEYKSNGIRIYAASSGADRPLRPEIRDLVRPVLVPKRIDPLDRVTRFYDLRTESAELEPTAALTVFRDVCGITPDPEIETIRLFWRALPQAGWNDRWLDCRRRPAFPLWIFQNRQSDFREDCPSTPTVPVRILLEPTEAEDPEIDALLPGGIVLYGTHFVGAADLVNTPLHNDLPGVFLHATALDNLITLGPHAARHSEHEIPILGVAWADVGVLVLAGVFSTVWRMGGPLPTWLKRLRRRTPVRVLRVALVLLGSQVGLLLLLITLASAFGCAFGAAYRLSGLGVNFLFAIGWTEILEAMEKLVEAADEFEDAET